MSRGELGKSRGQEFQAQGTAWAKVLKLERSQYNVGRHLKKVSKLIHKEQEGGVWGNTENGLGDHGKDFGFYSSKRGSHCKLMVIFI